jgi:hypothetical protein
MEDVGKALGTVGVWSMELRAAGQPEVREAAAELDALGVPALWLPGLDGNGVLDDVEQLLAAAPRTTIMLGILSIWRQDPTTRRPPCAAGGRPRGADARRTRGKQRAVCGGERSGARLGHGRHASLPGPAGRGSTPGPGAPAAAGRTRAEDGRPRGGADGRLIEALTAWSDLDDVDRRVREHLDAGADHVALHVLSTDRPGSPGGGLPLRRRRRVPSSDPSTAS